MALITGDSTTDQRVAVLNRYSERERERGGGVVGREGGRGGGGGDYSLLQKN